LQVWRVKFECAVVRSSEFVKGVAGDRLDRFAFPESGPPAFVGTKTGGRPAVKAVRAV